MDSSAKFNGKENHNPQVNSSKTKNIAEHDDDNLKNTKRTATSENDATAVNSNKRVKVLNIQKKLNYGPLPIENLDAENRLPASTTYSVSRFDDILDMGIPGPSSALSVENQYAISDQSEICANETENFETSEFNEVEVILPFILRGEFYTVVNYDPNTEAITAKCLLCDDEKDNVHKGSKQITSNFWTHLKVQINLLSLFSNVIRKLNFGK